MKKVRKRKLFGTREFSLLNTALIRYRADMVNSELKLGHFSTATIENCVANTVKIAKEFDALLKKVDENSERLD